MYKHVVGLSVRKFVRAVSVVAFVCNRQVLSNVYQQMQALLKAAARGGRNVHEVAALC